MNAITTPVAKGYSLFSRIGTFLKSHQLEDSPLNYGLVHAYLTQRNPVLVKAVDAIIADGFRLKQQDVDRLSAHIGGSPVPTASVPAEQELMQRQAADFADLVDASRSHAKNYGHDLRETAVKLASNGAADELLQITHDMIERNREVEARLAEATREAVMLRQRLESAEEEARSDRLTGIANRRAFEEACDDAKASGEKMCLAICDVDRFKKLNDTHGHAVGDRVLRLIAASMVEGCSPHHVARFGGEEFVVLFKGVSLEEAVRKVDDVRAMVSGKTYRVRETDQPIEALSFSAGIVEVASDEFPDKALERADALLYRAKSNGRNRIES